MTEIEDTKSRERLEVMRFHLANMHWVIDFFSVAKVTQLGRSEAIHRRKVLWKLHIDRNFMGVCLWDFFSYESEDFEFHPRLVMHPMMTRPSDNGRGSSVSSLYLLAEDHTSGTKSCYIACKYDFVAATMQLSTHQLIPRLLWGDFFISALVQKCCDSKPRIPQGQHLISFFRYPSFKLLLVLVWRNSSKDSFVGDWNMWSCRGVDLSYFGRKSTKGCYPRQRHPVDQRSVI